VKFSCSINNGMYKNLPFEVQSTGKWLLEDLVTSGKLTLSKKEIGKFDLNLYNLFSKEPEIKSNIAFRELTAETFEKAIKNFTAVEKMPGRLICTKNINTHITTEGKIANPVVILNVNATNVDYSGPLLPAKISSAELRAKFTKNFKQIKIDKFKLESDEQTIAVVSNKIDISKPNKGNFDAIVELQNYKMGPVVFFGKTSFIGNWNKKDTVFYLNSVVKPENLWVNQQRIRKVTFNVDCSVDDQKTLVKFSRVAGEQFAPLGKIEIANNKIKFSGVKLKQGMTLCKLNGAYSKDKCNISIEGNNVDAETLLGLINTQIHLSGRVDFTIVVRGSVDKPYIAGTVNIFAGEFYSVPFTNANLQFAYSNYVLKLVNGKVVRIDKGEEQLLFTAKGEIPTKIDSAKKIDLSVNLEKGNLSILNAISEDVKKAVGKVEGKLQVKGEVTKPTYSGYLVISDGDIQPKKYFDRLRRLNVAIAFEKNKIEMKEFSGRIGDGKFRLDGYLLLSKMFDIEEYNLVFYTTEKKGLKIFIPELPIPAGRFFKSTGLEEIVKNYSYGEPHAELKLTGKKDNIKLTGYIKLDNTRFSYPPPAGSEKSAFLYKIMKNVCWDVEIKSGENTWYENELMNVNIAGGLKIRGTPGEFIVNGKIESIRGSINYINKEYEIKEAIFEVINNECFLQAKAQTQAVFTVTALSAGRTQKETGKVEMIIPRSTIGQIVPQFSSRDHPELTSEKLIQATYGITTDMEPSERDLLLRKQLVQLFDSSLASPLAKSILQRSGLVDAVRVTYSPASTTLTDETSAASPTSPSIAELLAGTKYTLEKYITGDLLLGYALTLGEMQRRLDLRHEFELAYRWKGNIFVRGIYGFEPRKTIERDDWQIKVEPHWRFGWPTETEKKD
ncbi:MAG: translocation/assembly module TamB domain-containing protein, partial [Elusimicrobiota bacterium]|nr:translocation/assembly module TamB domain-containing protein [Elusimicrobiota bacterium]